MASGHEQHELDHHHHHGGHGPKALPLDLNSLATLMTWRMRALMVFAVSAVISLVFLFVPTGRTHMLRAYLLGFMICFSFAGGGLVMLMLQYVSGGKWGMLLRRPLEAMSRTLPLVALMVIPILALGKYLYQWMRFPDQGSRAGCAEERVGDQGAGTHGNFEVHHVQPGQRSDSDRGHLRRFCCCSCIC